MFKTISSKAAAQIDRDLMSSGAFSIDQLMELAGLAVAQAIYKEYPPVDPNKTLLVLVGPGNNGGDGLVASRHLKLWGYDPIIYYPKKSSKNQLYQNLLKQLQDLDIPEVSEVKSLFESSQSSSSSRQLGPKLIVDALFGFSFKPPIRSPFDDVLSFLAHNSEQLPPIVSIDIPSGWDVDAGPIEGNVNIDPTMLISLTAPKGCATKFAANDKVHYLGGRFISQKMAKEYEIEDLVGSYEGDQMIVKL